MHRQYFDKHGKKNQSVFDERLAEIHNMIEGADYHRLFLIRDYLYHLNGVYRRCGKTYAACEEEIRLVNSLMKNML